MSREAQNAQFLRTSFLSGTNAAYIEQMQAEYEANPGSVGDEWRHFFESLKEERGATEPEPLNPSWATPLEKLANNGDLVSALTNDYGAVERRVRDTLAERAQANGVELTPMRFGFAPLYVRFADCFNAVTVLREVMLNGAWKAKQYHQQNSVT